MTSISRAQAQAIVDRALIILAAEKFTADENGGSPEADAQLKAVLDVDALIARDTPDHR